MAFVISGYRYTLSGAEIPSSQYMISTIPLFIVLVSGLFYFRRVEDRVAENV
jgi:ABC-type polysaccharide/polyol phosphate export permease